MTQPDSSITPAALHNARDRDQQSQPEPEGPHEAFLTVERAGRPEHTPDVEGVVVRFDERSITFLNEDGSRDVYDRTELLTVLGAA